MIHIPGYNARNPWVDSTGRLTVQAQAWLAGLVGAVNECQIAAEAGAVNRADVQVVADAVAALAAVPVQQAAGTDAAVPLASVPFIT